MGTEKFLHTAQKAEHDVACLEKVMQDSEPDR
jgi:hypothetical protein